MSNADYSLEIRLDNTQLKQQIEEIRKAFGGSGGGGGSRSSQQNSMTSALDKVFGGLAKKGFASIISMGLKLSGMAIVFEKMSKAVVDASPMLKAMLKLMDYGIMFMLRPIGDFIGFLLKPIMLFFFKNVAIPFYKYMAPFMQKYGNAIGMALTDPRVGIPAAVGLLVGLGITAKSMLDKITGFATDIKTVADKVKSDTTATPKTKTKNPFDPNVDLSGGSKGGQTSLSIDSNGKVSVKTSNKDPFNSATDLGGGGNSMSRLTDPNAVAGSKSLAKSGGMDLKSAMSGAKAKLSSSGLKTAQQMIAERIAGGDMQYVLDFLKYGGAKALKAIVKNLPEIGIIVAAATGDPSWIIPGYGGLAGGGESGGLDYSQTPQVNPNRFGANPQTVKNLNSGGTSTVNVNVTGTLDLNDPQTKRDLQDMISKYIQSKQSRQTR